MQLTEIFRRGIVLPRNQCSFQQFQRWDISGSVLVNFIPILQEQDFEIIWQSGVFQSLNSVCSLNIDDYEEEVLPVDKLSAAIAHLRIISNTLSEGYVIDFVENLIDLSAEGDRIKMPIFFIL